MWILVLLVALGAAATLWQAQNRERAAETAYPAKGQFISVDGIRMHAVVDGAGPDVVLIHGSSGSVRDFTSGLMPELAKHYRVIAIDRPGLGWSDVHPEGDSLSVQAGLIRETAAALGAKKPIVLGQSYGGAVALAWAVDRPDTVAALVPVSAVSHPWTTGLGRYYGVLSHPLGQALVIPLMTAFVPESAVRRSVAEVFEPQSTPPDYIENFGPGMTLRRTSMRANARQRRALLDQVVALAPHYKDLKLPIEIIHGDADDAVNIDLHARSLQRDVAGANLTVLEGVGHMPHHVAIGAVVAAVDRTASRAGLRADDN